MADNSNMHKDNTRKVKQRDLPQEVLGMVLGGCKDMYRIQDGDGLIQKCFLFLLPSVMHI